MATERMLVMDAVPDKKEPLLDEELSAPRPCRRRTAGKGWIAIIVVGGLVAMAIMFLGGFYAGRHHDHHDNPPPSSSQYYRLATSDGAYTDLPALQGNQPAEDFLQCRAVQVNGKSVCMASNPAVTSKGNVLLTLYQYQGKVSLIVTGCGASYGENSTTRSRRDTSQDQNIDLHVDGFKGDVSEPTADDYYRDFGMQHFDAPSHVVKPMAWNSLGSHATILHFNMSKDMPAAKIYFEKALAGLRASLLSGKNFSHLDFGQLPTKAQPLSLSMASVPMDYATTDYEQPEDSQVDLRNTLLEEFAIFLESLFDVHQNDVRNVRSATPQTTKENGVFFKLFDRQNPKKALSSIRIIHDPRHGGENGTVIYDITNHTAGCRAQFSTLYHSFLSNGNEMENATHHQTYIYHYMNRTGGHRLAMWQAVTPFSDPASSTVKPLVGEVPSDLPCIGDEMYQLQNRLKTGMDEKKIPYTQRKLLWSCGFMDSLRGGYDCASSGYSCYSGVKNSHWKISSLFGAAKTCLGAGQNCYGFFNKCK